jgi:glycerol-3-phosphate O-acyltransferase
VNFGTPVSARHWIGEHPSALELPWEVRSARLQSVADEVMQRVNRVMPVTPVPLVAAALLSLARDIVSRQDVLRRIEEFCNYLERADAKLVHAGNGAAVIMDHAERMLRLRRLVHFQGDSIVILPSQRPVLEFYANSVRHLLPATAAIPEGALLRLADVEI